MAFIGCRFVSELGHGKLKPVVGEHLSGESTVQDVLPGDADDDGARTLAVEILLVEEVGYSVGVQQLDALDELEVLAVDGQLLASLYLFAIHLGITGNHGLSETQGERGFGLAVGGADQYGAARGCDA